jgi:TBC1 domain family member 8/9
MLEEPKTRESLLTPQMRHKASQASIHSINTEPISSSDLRSDSTITRPTPAPINVNPTMSQPSTSPGKLKAPEATPQPDSAGPTPVAPPYARMSIHAATLIKDMETRRAAFAIDDSLGEDEEGDGEGLDEENDETVMDEVDAFLEENDSGLTDADKEVAKGG